MNKAQKIIKYVAIVVAISLIVTIITSIVTGILAIAGVSAFIDGVSDSVETIDYTKEYTNIRSVEIDVKSINLEIMPSSEQNADILKVEGSRIPVQYKFENKNGELKIQGKKVKSDSKLVIYLPESVKELDVDVGAGNIQVKNINIEEFNLDVGATQTNIDNLTVTSKADIDAGTGEIIMDNSNISNLDMDAGLGNIEYNGYLNETSDINCGVGNIQIDLFKTDLEYKIIAERGIGELKINGTILSGPQTIGNGTNIVKISGGIGSVSVTY